MGSVENVLSARMKAVAALVTPGNRVCDVGCDHGYISIYLVQQGISPTAIATDVREGPLKRAKEHIGKAGLADYIETRLSDGLERVSAGECETVICAGMGGKLMVRILSDGEEVARSCRELILQPQSKLSSVREYLYEQGYRIMEEDMVLEEGKYYPMLRVCKGAAPAAQGEALRQKFGPCLLEERHPVLREYLEWRREVYSGILEQLAAGGQSGRMEEIRQELEEIEQALLFYTKSGNRS